MQHKSGCNPSLINARLPECLQYTVPVEKKAVVKAVNVCMRFSVTCVEGCDKQAERKTIHTQWMESTEACVSQQD